MPLIIVEGVDGSGKTTLVNELAHLAPDHARVKHCGPLTRPALVEYESSLYNYNPVSDYIICDRWHVGELVYGPLYRGMSELTPPQVMHIEAFLEARGAVRVVMDTPVDVVKDRLAHRGEEFLQSHHVQLVADFYTEYAIGSVYWDGFNSVFDGSVEKIMDTAVMAAGDASTFVRYPSLIAASLDPYVLIVTEPSQADRVSGIASYPVPGSAGAYLMAAMQNAGAEYGWAMVSASDPAINTLWQRLHRPPIISLGQSAADAVRRARLEPALALVGPSTLIGRPHTGLHHYAAPIAALIEERVNGG